MTVALPQVDGVTNFRSLEGIPAADGRRVVAAVFRFARRLFFSHGILPRCAVVGAVALNISTVKYAMYSFSESLGFLAMIFPAFLRVFPKPLMLFWAFKDLPREAWIY